MAYGKERNVLRVLNPILDATSQLIDFQRIYVAMYDRATTNITFPLVTGKKDNEFARIQVEKTRPFAPNDALPDLIFTHQKPVLIPTAFETWIGTRGLRYEPPLGTPTPMSWLGIPLRGKSRALGVVVLEHVEKEYAYNERTSDVLEAICARAASILRNYHLIDNLVALNTIGQELASTIDITEDQILHKIYDQVRKLMDTRNMYIAMYDPERQRLSFPLAFRNGEAEKWSPRDIGSTPQGLTEVVIQTKEPLCPEDVQACYDLNQITPKILPVPKSWLGVPIIQGLEVFGVISLQNDEIQNLYGVDDINLLETMAAQVSLALGNVRAARELALRERALEANRWGVEVAHHLNNIAGAIPTRAKLIIDLLDPYDITQSRALELAQWIRSDSLRLLELANVMRDGPPTYDSKELVDVNLVMRQAHAQAEQSLTEAERSKVKIQVEYGDDLPKIVAGKTSLEQVFCNIIGNALDAVKDKEQGRIHLSTKKATNQAQQPVVVIQVEDNGVGIKPEHRDRVFNPLFTTKARGLGMGLWLAKTNIERFGGQINVSSEPDLGSTFVITLPAGE